VNLCDPDSYRDFERLRGLEFLPQSITKDITKYHKEEQLKIDHFE